MKPLIINHINIILGQSIFPAIKSCNQYSNEDWTVETRIQTGSRELT